MIFHSKGGTYMNCEYELDFLCGILKKCHIRTALLSPHDTTDALVDSWIRTILGITPRESGTVREVMGDIEDTTEYKFRNELELHYIFMKLPLSDENNLLFIGPYLPFPLASKDVLKIGEKLNFSSNMQKNLSEYYASLPVIPESDRIFVAIDTFCERVWQTSSFSVTEIRQVPSMAISSLFQENTADDFDEILANMEKMEMRYAFENELIQAVSLGQQHREKTLLSAFNEQMFERRLQDSVRNAKNYCIIMNTLLRKAAEKGGVHPLYIDRTSSKFAAKIEFTADIKAIPALMREMFSSYCRLVRKHSTKQYSPVVKKTILMIDSDIAAELSLHILAEKQDITPGYLSTVFKKETQKTVSEYIRERRIRHAEHLLSTTNLQIQTIAMHCGIMDVQYFSKVFKRMTGKTPREYRESVSL